MNFSFLLVFIYFCLIKKKINSESLLCSISKKKKRSIKKLKKKIKIFIDLCLEKASISLLSF